MYQKNEFSYISGVFHWFRNFYYKFQDSELSVEIVVDTGHYVSRQNYHFSLRDRAPHLTHGT